MKKLVVMKESSPISIKKFLTGILLTCLILASLSPVFTIKTVYAQIQPTGTVTTVGTADEACPTPTAVQVATGGLGFFGSSIARCIFHSIKESNPVLDIIRPTLDMVAAAIINVPIHWLYGRSPDQLHYCIAQAAGCSVTGILAEENEGHDCSDLEYNPLAALLNIDSPTPTTTRAFGTLGGLTVSLMDVNYRTEPPVNLAFYVKSVAQQVPILGDTAFAQTSQPGSITLQVVLEVWKIFRNAAYGLMAVFMLVIGIMIMMRKQLDPKTSVTIQNALPRIIIAVVLITFSYAIGAFAIALIPALITASLEPLRALVEDRAQLGRLGPMIIIAMSVWKALGLFGVGGIALLLATTAMITLLLLLIWVLVKGFMAYFKIVVSIVLAPIIFAWGAIPGNEKATEDWFKELAVNVLVIPGMLLFIGLAFLLAWKIELATFCATVVNPTFSDAMPEFALPFLSSSTAFGGSVMVALKVPLMMMFLFFFAGKLPKALHEAIMGPPKRK